MIEAILNSALPQVFGYLESSIDGDFIAGGQFTIADIAIVSNLINFHYLGYALDERHPKLRRYFAGHIERPSIRTALLAEKSVAASMGLDGSFLRTAAAVAQRTSPCTSAPVDQDGVAGGGICGGIHGSRRLVPAHDAAVAA